MSSNWGSFSFKNSSNPANNSSTNNPSSNTTNINKWPSNGNTDSNKNTNQFLFSSKNFDFENKKSGDVQQQTLSFSNVFTVNTSNNPSTTDTSKNTSNITSNAKQKAAFSWNSLSSNNTSNVNASNSSKSETNQKTDEKESNISKNDKKRDILRIADMSIEQILQTWELELDAHVKNYLRHASKIRHWDERLINNSEKIHELQNKVTSLMKTQSIFNSSLEKIRGQQKNLTNILQQLENTLGTNDNGIGSAMDMGANDVQYHRRQLYENAENIDRNLSNLNEKLHANIKELNEKSASKEHAFTPVVDILNIHMESLNWIDSKCSEIVAQVGDIQTVLK